MSRSDRLDNYLAKLDKALGPISISEKAEIITEIKSHIIEAQSRNEDQTVESVIASLGEPEQVASKYLLDKGLELVKPPKHPVVKWIVLGFLGTFLIAMMFITIIIFKFTPLVNINGDAGKIEFLGGLIRIDSGNGSSAYSFKIIENNTFSAEDLNELRVMNPAGVTKVTSHKSNKIELEYQNLSNSEECKLLYDIKKAKLILKATQSGDSFFDGSVCKINLNIKVPEGSSLRINNGIGTVSLEGVFKDADLASGNGDININGSLSDARVVTGKGNIKFVYDKAPQNGTLKLKTGYGDISLFIPSGSKIYSNLKIGSGNIHNEFHNSNEGNFTIDAKTGNGNISINKI